jgi:uncharacterized protein YcfJ
LEIEMTTRVQIFMTALFVVIAVPVMANSEHEWAEVVDVQPISEIVQIPQDRQVCREVPVQRRVVAYRSPAPVVFGAIVGGIIGSQISRGHGHHNKHGRKHGRHNGRHGHSGHGNNRIVATVAGAAIGGAIAGGIQYHNYPPTYYTSVSRVCSTETSWRSEKSIVGWDVSWRYRGQIYHSRMDEPPGDSIKVSVNVAPVYP